MGGKVCPSSSFAARLISTKFRRKMLTTEEQTQLEGLLAKQAAAKSTEPAAKPSEPSKEPTKTITEEAKAAVEAEKAAGLALGQIQESVKFNLSVSKFVEDNKSLLPDEAAKILATVATKTFKDENEKANTVRQSLLDSFLSQKENIDVLTAPMKARAESYKALAESDKLRKSSEFWELVETGAALKQLSRKAEALNRANGISPGGSSDVIQSKFLAAAKEKFKSQQL